MAMIHTAKNQVWDGSAWASYKAFVAARNVSNNTAMIQNGGGYFLDDIQNI